MTNICAKIDFSLLQAPVFSTRRAALRNVSPYTCEKLFDWWARTTQKGDWKVFFFPRVKIFHFPFSFPSLDASCTHTNEATFLFLANEAQNECFFIRHEQLCGWMDEGLTDEERAASQMCLFISHTKGDIKRMRTATAIERAMTAIILKTLEKLSQAFRWTAKAKNVPPWLIAPLCCQRLSPCCCFFPSAFSFANVSMRRFSLMLWRFIFLVKRNKRRGEKAKGEMNF